jgi:hypothetical protein
MSREWPRASGQWSSTKKLADSINAEIVAILQPHAGMGEPVTDHLKLDEHYLKAYEALYPTIVQLLEYPEYRELSNHVLNLTDAFDQDEYIYIDFCHVSPNGNRIIAQRIIDYIENGQDMN